MCGRDVHIAACVIESPHPVRAALGVGAGRALALARPRALRNKYSRDNYKIITTRNIIFTSTCVDIVHPLAQLRFINYSLLIIRCNRFLLKLQSFSTLSSKREEMERVRRVE